MDEHFDERELERLTETDGVGDPTLLSAWERFGEVLSAATDAEMVKCRPITLTKPRRIWVRWTTVATSLAAAVLACWLGISPFLTDSSSVPDSEVAIVPWDEDLDEEMETLHQDLEEMPEDSPVDSEIALVFASLDTMDSGETF